MAHRGLLREMYGMICLTLLFPQSERGPVPTPHTTFIEDVVDTFTNENAHTIPTTPLSTPSATGFLGIFLGILTFFLALLGDEAINRIAHAVLFNCLLPLARITGRHIITYGTRIYRRVRGQGIQVDNTRQNPVEIDDSSRSTSAQVRASTPDDSIDEWFDAVESQPSPVEIPDNTPVPPVNDQALADLRAESQEKDDQIAKLNKTIRVRDMSFDNLNGRHSSLLEGLRSVLDPRSLYPRTANVVTIAGDIQEDIRRLSKTIRQKDEELKESRDREERGQLAEKDREVAGLQAQNATLDGRILRLEREQLSSVYEVQASERRTEERMKSLRDRLLEAQTAAGQGVSSRDHQTLRNQFASVAANLQRARQERQDAISAQQVLTTELNNERAQSQQQRENTAETHDLELANSRIVALEQGALSHGEEVRGAETRAQTAERRAQAAEEKATTDATTHQQNLQEVRGEAQKTQESVKQLKKDLQAAKKALKVKEDEAKAKPEVAATRPNQDLVAENNNLRVKLDEAAKKESEAYNNGYLQAQAENPPSRQSQETPAATLSYPVQQDASCQTNAPADDPLYQQERREERRACEEQAQTLIHAAVRQARQEGEEAQRAAVARNEQALKASAEAAWASHEARLRADFDAAAQTSASEGASLRGQLQTAVQRAIRAESTLANTNAALTAEQESSAEMQTNASREWERAQRAEGEVEKFKKGKQSQDGRIQGYLDDIARLKRLIPRDAELAAAELNATMGDRARSTALMDESLHRHYDHPTREVVQQLLAANAKILALKGLLKNPPVTATQKELWGALKDAEVDKKLFESLDFSLRQVLVKQCRAVNARVADLRMIILERREPDRATLLRAIYQNRGDEEAEWFDEDPKTGSSSNEDDDDEDPAPTSQVQRPAARPMRQPVSRRSRPQPQPQPQAQASAPDAAPTPSAEGSSTFSFGAPKEGASGTIAQSQTPVHTN